jgi:4-hydroxybenzoate polyprenyltransferase
LQKIKAIYTITRFPNLVFIFLTQVLVHQQLIAKPILLNNTTLLFSNLEMILLATSTTLIAAGGYIINDYFDVKIDEINKPNRVTVELQFKRRQIMFAQIILNFVALVLSLPLALKAGHISLIGIQLLCILLLVLYSAYFKRQVLSGNIVVAILTALTVYTPAIYEAQILGYDAIYSIAAITLFAFLFTLLREIIKDLEDIKGDEADACKTLPIVYGTQASKRLSYGIAFCIIVFLGMIAHKMLGNHLIIGLSCLLIACATIYFMIELKKASGHHHFKFLSRLLKIITFIGILQIYFI